jgi:hypothetical protein
MDCPPVTHGHEDQKVARTPPKTLIGGASVRLRALVDPGAWINGTEVTGENVPNVA